MQLRSGDNFSGTDSVSLCDFSIAVLVAVEHAGIVGSLVHLSVRFY